MFWSVAASKAAAAINNKIASKCSISTVCQLSSLAGLMVELCLSFRNSKLISKQSSSSNMDCSILPANNKLCSPPPAPGNTGAPHVIYSPVPCFLPETSSEKNKLTQHQSRARLNPRVLQELPWGTTKLEHPQCPTHTWVWEASSYLWWGSSWWHEWLWPSPQAPCSHFLWTMKELWQVSCWHPHPHPVGNSRGQFETGKNLSTWPGHISNYTSETWPCCSGSQPYPMGEIPTLCSLQPRNVPSLRIHSNEQETCTQHLKTYQAQNKQVVRPSTKRSTGKNPEHLFFF